MIQISEHVRNGPNYKILDFLAFSDYRDQFSENILDYESRMSKLKQLLVDLYENFRPFQKWNKLQVTFFFYVSGPPDQYPVNVPDYKSGIFTGY